MVTWTIVSARRGVGVGTRSPASRRSTLPLRPRFLCWLRRCPWRWPRAALPPRAGAGLWRQARRKERVESMRRIDSRSAQPRAHTARDGRRHVNGHEHRTSSTGYPRTPPNNPSRRTLARRMCGRSRTAMSPRCSRSRARRPELRQSGRLNGRQDVHSFPGLRKRPERAAQNVVDQTGRTRPDRHLVARCGLLAELHQN
jgi:hypothetical protein